MLLIYDRATGVIASNSGTNSRQPRGPSFDLEVQNAINKHGGEPADYAGFRLHDVDDADTVQAILGAESYELVFENGTPTGVTNIVPRPVVEPEPQPEVGDFIEALIDYFGVDRANDLMASYPAFVRALDGGTRWDLAQYLMGKMLNDQAVTQQEFDDVQGLWDTHHLPRPE